MPSPRAASTAGVHHRSTTDPPGVAQPLGVAAGVGAAPPGPGRSVWVTTRRWGVERGAEVGRVEVRVLDHAPGHEPQPVDAPLERRHRVGPGAVLGHRDHLPPAVEIDQPTEHAERRRVRARCREDVRPDAVDPVVTGTPAEGLRRIPRRPDPDQVVRSVEVDQAVPRRGAVPLERTGPTAPHHNQPPCASRGESQSTGTPASQPPRRLGRDRVRVPDEQVIALALRVGHRLGHIGSRRLGGEAAIPLVARLVDQPGRRVPVRLDLDHATSLMAGDRLLDAVRGHAALHP